MADGLKADKAGSPNRVATAATSPASTDEPPVVRQGAGAALPAARRLRPAHLLPKLGLTLLSFAVVLAALEGATRLFSHVVPPLICNDPVVGTRYLPGFSDWVYVPECDRDVLLTFNHDGMRGPDFPVEKSPGVCRVAVVGDSMVAAVATDEEMTLVRRLEKRLNANPSGTRYEVMNFGISGSSTGQELVLYREVVRKYRPDVVVCAFCVANDLGDNCTGLTSNRGRIYFDVDDEGRLEPLPFSPGRARLTSWLNRYSRFYVWQKSATQLAINTVRTGVLAMAAKVGHEAAPLESGGLGIFCTAPGDTLNHAWLITDKLVETMSREVHDDGAEFFLAVLPAGWQVCDDIWTRTIEHAGGEPMSVTYPDEKLTEIGTRAQAEVVLMTDMFRAAAPHHAIDYEDELLHYDGLGHFNDRGNDVAAAAIHKAIAGRGERVASAPGAIAR
jgi:hypothetical protein